MSRQRTSFQRDEHVSACCGTGAGTIEQCSLQPTPLIMAAKTDKNRAEEAEIMNQISVWFQLRKYDQFREMTAHQWGTQMSRRLLIDQMLTAVMGPPMDETVRGLITKQLDEYMDDLIKNPLGKDIDLPTKLQPIAPLTVQNIENIHTLLTKWYRKLPSMQVTDSTELDSLFGLQNGMAGCLFVNLGARDSEIISEFKSWLEQRRSVMTRKSAPAKLRTKALHEWVNGKLLPYSDLMMWGRWQKLQVTEDMLAEVLFPGMEIDPHVKIRPVKEMFDKYMTAENAFALVSAP